MLENKKPEFDKVVLNFQAELKKLRTNRANSAMIEDIKVDYYGTPTPVKQLGSISTPEPRQILLQPWDKSVLPNLEKAIRDAGLGFNPVNEGDKIRITLPELTEERRKELVKQTGKIAEETRVRLRQAREDILKEIKKQEEDGKIREDERFRLQEKLQEMIDDYNKTIKELLETKEKQIMTV